MKVSSLVNLVLSSQAVPEAPSWFHQIRYLPRITKMCSVRFEKFHPQIPTFARLLKSWKIWSILCGTSLNLAVDFGLFLAFFLIVFTKNSVTQSIFKVRRLNFRILNPNSKHI